MAKKRAKARCKHKKLSIKHSLTDGEYSNWQYIWCENCHKGWQPHIALKRGIIKQ